MKLSVRQQRLFAPDTTSLALKALNEAEMGNSTLIKDKNSYDIRTKHLLEAVAAMQALDVDMKHIWGILMTNPQGAFTNSKGKTISSGDAIIILDSMAESLGSKIDAFINFTNKIIVNEREKYIHYVDNIDNNKNFNFD